MNYLSLFKSLLIIYVMLGVLLYVFQRSMIYYPTAAITHNFKALKLPNKGITVEALVTHDQGQHAILYFGGNAENVAYTAGDFFQEFPGHTTYLMKYRGYSGAEGTASEASLYADALTLFDTIKLNHKKIIIIGRSLGSGIATYIATERTVEKLILVTPFDSLRSVAQSLLPVFPMDWVLKDHFDSKARAAKIIVPTLVVMATKDQIISNSHTESLMQAIPDHQLSITQINAGHNDLDMTPQYFNSMKLFLTAK